MSTPPRRKKWSEAEERTLIDKYGELVSNGILVKMKTREKKFRPIALFVNSMHHVRDPLSFPCQWSWKDVSTKVQNMRHQYLLVKQKIKKIDLLGHDDFDWSDGLSHWSNFLRYKEVFGDVPLIDNNIHHNDNDNFDNLVDLGNSGEAPDFDGVLGFGYHEEEDDDEDNFNQDGDEIEGGFVFNGHSNGNGSELRRKKKVSNFKKNLSFSFIANQLSQLKGMEIGFEHREAEREREREAREIREKERLEEMNKEREKRKMEWEAMEKKCEERRREEMLEWEERMKQRRLDWKKRMDDMITQHRAEMNEMQSRILHDQQNLTTQLLAIWSAHTHPNALNDHTGNGATNHYLSQMMHNLHHINSMVHHDTRVEGDNQDDQFIVDG